MYEDILESLVRARRGGHAGCHHLGADAGGLSHYFAFVAFFFWVCFRERSAFARVLWLILIFLLGNIAMATYALIQLAKLKPDEPASALFARPAA